MTDYTIATTTNPGAPADPSRALPVRDGLLDGVLNNGVRFIWDADFSFSYPGGAFNGRPAAANPTNGQTIYDVAERANGSVAVTTAGQVLYAGGGFDATNTTAIANGPLSPAAAMADIFTAFGGKSQRFLVAGWFKIPVPNSGSWASSSSSETIMGDRQDVATPALGSIGMNNLGTGLTYRRQTSVGNVSALALTPNEGGLALIAMFRTDTLSGMYYRSASQRLPVTQAVGTDNTADFSANQMGWVRPNVFTNFTAGANPRLSGLRGYRGFIENLARSARDPLAVLDAEWTRVQARITANITANGTQTIFI